MKHPAPAPDDRRLTPEEKARLAALRRGLCGRVGRWYPALAAAMTAAGLLLGFAPPTRGGDIAFLILCFVLLVTLPAGMKRPLGFAVSLRAVRRSGRLAQLLEDWPAASGRFQHEAALGERFAFSRADGRFFAYDEITRITPGPGPGERGLFRQSWTLLMVELAGQRPVAFGRCSRQPAMAYQDAQARLEEALRGRAGGRPHAEKP